MMMWYYGGCDVDDDDGNGKGGYTLSFFKRKTFILDYFSFVV